MSRLRLVAPALLLVLLAPAAPAHPVPRSSHDRTVVVHVSGDREKSVAVVEVRYRLEVDELTVLVEDMVPFADKIDLGRFRNRPGAFYTEFTGLYAPILADNLVAKADGKPLTFACVGREHRLRDEKGEPLGHLRCDFVFRGTFPVDEKREKPIAFEFREGNYELQAGKVDVSLTAGPPVKVVSKTEADAEVKKRAEIALRPGDEEKLRRVSASLQWDTGDLRREERPSPPAPEGSEEEGGPEGLFLLFLQSGEGMWWLLLPGALALGAAHALTPGHGKTLVAAYLVGERGTTLHALVLGLLTTLTHTGIVLLFALVLRFASEEVRRAVESGLGLGMGLAIALLGFWLLVRRLAGRADHVHIGGHGHHHHHHHGHHHHHHHHADHDHDEHGNVIPARRHVGWWGIVVLGMSGGIIPCWDAVAILGFAVGKDQPDLALPLLLAFSAGLAGVLVLFGVLAVRVRRFTESRWGEGRLVRALPILSAVFIAAMGVWLCYDSVHAQPARPDSPPRAAAARP